MGELGINDSKTKLLFACSGAADVGALSDLSARLLHREGVGKMYCLAGIGAKINSFIETTSAASMIIAIDGCQMDCAKKSLENAGIASFHSLRITDLGLQKGKSEINNQNIETVAAKGREIINGSFLGS